MTLEQRVIIVTGAGRGIGRCHVDLLARQGARVVVNDVGVEGNLSTGETVSVAEETVHQLRSEGLEATSSRHDISDWQASRELVDMAIDTYGRLDGVVNNAGILRDRMLFNMSGPEWDDVVGVHLRGTAAVLSAAAAYWRGEHRRGQGVQASVVNTTSPSGLFGKIGQSNYGAAKAGIAALTMIAAEELRPYDVTVNAVAPVAYTRMTADLIADEQAQEALAPEHVSPVVAWLSGTGSRHVTGRVFEVSGRRFCLVDPWRRGRSVEPHGLMGVAEVGPIVDTFLDEAAPHERMGGNL